MTNFRFTYRTESGEIKNDILIESEEREDAIAVFEDTYPKLKWFQTATG